MSSADTTMERDTQKPRYSVVVRNDWSYIVGGPYVHGPFRYRWEAQEYADELNRDPIRCNKTKDMFEP